MHVELYKGAQVKVVDLEGQYTVDKLEMAHVVVCNEVETLKVERWRLTVVDSEASPTGELLDIDMLPDQEAYLVYRAFNRGELTALEGAKKIGEIEARKKATERGKLLTQQDIDAARLPKATFYRRAVKVEKLGGIKGMQRRPHGKKGGHYFSSATRKHVRNRAKEYKKEDYTKKGFVKILRDELALYRKGKPELYSGVPSFETVRGWLQEDLKKLRKARSSAGRGYDEPDTLLHTVQIDHCLLNADLRDDEGNVVGRPWLTLAIDVASRVIFGFYLSLRDPSAVSISGVLSMCVLPKRSKGEFWPYGIMLFLHADNGPDLRSNALELGCQHWNIDLDWRPTETPEYGAHIESLVGKVKQWVRDLPGGCTFDEKNRKRSLSKPAWTIQRLRSWLTDRIQNSYHTTSHSGIGNLTPLQAYETLLVGTDERPGLGQVKQVPAGREEEFRISFLPAYNPTLNEEGVVINYLHYNANELQTMLKRIGPGNKRWVRRDHNDISAAYIWNSETKTYITARSRRTKPLSTKMWEKAKDLVDEEGIDKNEDAILAKVEQLEQAEENTQRKDKTRQELREQAHEQDVTPPPQPTPVDLSNVQAAGSELDWDDSWDSDG